ncbi:MAG: hypothetical protein FWE29_03605 [Defluviitaleaceae bacterium]|nr:hypothetical protein [Defluviitaleaceae bacterium]
MSLIAIASEENCDQTFNLLKRIYDNTREIQSPTIQILNETIPKSNANILIINSPSKLSKNYAAFLKDGGFLLLNSDEKSSVGQIELKNATVISYGFNKKSSVTASSISHDEFRTIQICIQRPLPTVSGQCVIEQEFSINISSKEINDHSILVAVTAALVNDFPPDAFADAVYFL